MLVPHHAWQLKISRDISVGIPVEVHLEEWAIPPPQWFRTPRAPMSKEESPQHLAVKISGHFIRVRCKVALNPGALLKVPSTNPFTHKHSPYALVKRQQLKKSQRHIGRNWIDWLQVSAWGTALSGTQLLAGAIDSLWSPVSDWLAGISRQ